MPPRKTLPLMLAATLLGAAATAAAGDFVNYHTAQHHIRIAHTGNGYTYQSWNKPKRINQGRPDWQMTNGREETIGVNCTRQRCDMAQAYVFEKGNTRFEIIQIDYISEGMPRVYRPNMPKGADAELTVYLNGKQKQHYWLYQD